MRRSCFHLENERQICEPSCEKNPHCSPTNVIPELMGLSMMCFSVDLIPGCLTYARSYVLKHCNAIHAYSPRSLTESVPTQSNRREPWQGSKPLSQNATCCFSLTWQHRHRIALDVQFLEATDASQIRKHSHPVSPHIQLPQTASHGPHVRQSLQIT